MLSITKNIFKLKNFIKAEPFKASFILPASQSINFYNYPQYKFSTNANKPEDEEGPDSHDDFKPKEKVELNEENIMKQIDDVSVGMIKRKGYKPV